MNILVKTKNFINDAWLLVIRPIKFIQRLHHAITQIDEESIKQRRISRNPYQMFQDWLLDLVVYGLTIFPLYWMIYGWPGYKFTLLFVIAIGLARWWGLTLYKDYLKSRNED